MNVVNLAHGAFVLSGAYVAYELNDLVGLDPFLGMVPAAIVLFAAGYLLQRGLVNLVVNAPIFITLLLTFGLELLLVNGLLLVFTADYRAIPTSYAADSLVLPGDVRLPYGRLIAGAGARRACVRARRRPAAGAPPRGRGGLAAAAAAVVLPPPYPHRRRDPCH